METLFAIGLSNALVAGGLALMAAGVGAVVRRPALRHALWLLVLLKLVTPPLWFVSVEWPMPATPEPVAVVETSSVDEEVAAAPVVAPEVEEDLGPFEPADRVVTFIDEETSDPVPAPAMIPALEPLPTEPPTVVAEVPSWRWLAGGVWLAGTMVFGAVAGFQVLRFRSTLRAGRPADADLDGQAGHMARRLGLRRPPRIVLVQRTLSPMIWSLGTRPYLLLPEALWDRLTAEQRDSLLAHELAHLKRRDHWVRWLELVATGLYWWHPVVWWARREILEAEEECCDAWVVWALPASARAYASAIVDTLDYLNAAAPARPLGASGIGCVPTLKRRLTMILRGNTPRSLGWSGGLIVGLAAMILPWLPTWAQDAKPGVDKESPGKSEVDEKAVEIKRRIEKAQLQANEQVQQAVQEAEKVRRAMQERLRREQEQAEEDVKKANQLLEERVRKVKAFEQKQIEEAKRELSTPSDRADDFRRRSIEAARLRDEIRSTQRRLEEMRRKLDEIEVGRTPDQIRGNSDENMGKVLLEKNNHLLAQIAVLTKEIERLRSGMVSNQTLSNPPQKDVEGSVKSTDASGYITLSIGSDAGLRQGNTLEIYRFKPEPKYLGRVKIVNLNPVEAVAAPVSPLRVSAIQAGDRVGAIRAESGTPDLGRERELEQRLERKLNERFERLLREVESLRNEMRRGGAGSRGGPSEPKEGALDGPKIDLGRSGDRFQPDRPRTPYIPGGTIPPRGLPIPPEEADSNLPTPRFPRFDPLEAERRLGAQPTPRILRELRERNLKPPQPAKPLVPPKPTDDAN